jgi:hypothetical protein
MAAAVGSGQYQEVGMAATLDARAALGVMCACALSVGLISACGGGGNGGDSPELASLLSPVAVPLEREVPSGHVVGTVYEMPMRKAGAGVPVQVTDPAAGGAVVATTVTLGDGSFDLVLPPSHTASPRLLLTAATSGGWLRALAATPATDITVGSETVVRELEQRLRIGALQWADLDAEEADIGQRMVDFLAHSIALAEHAAPQSLVVALRGRLAYRADWNAWLSGLPSAARRPAGDIPMLVPRTDGFMAEGPWGGDFGDFRVELAGVGVPAGVAGDVRIGIGCRGLPARAVRWDDEQECMYGLWSGDGMPAIDPTRPPLMDVFMVGPSGIKVAPAGGLVPQAMHQPLFSMGYVPMLEYPWSTGTSVVYSANGLRARRTVLPLEGVTVGDATVKALPVVMDFDHAAGDLVVSMRVRTWFAPEIGRLKVEYEVKTQKSAGPVQSSQLSAIRTDLAAFRLGERKNERPMRSDPVLTGEMVAAAVPLRHDQTFYARSTRKLYASSADEAGVLAEIDVDTRAVRRSSPLGHAIRSIAATPDGARIYVGLASSAEVVELSAMNLAVLRRLVIPLATFDGAVRSAYRLAVDPADPLRLAALVHPNQVWGGDVVLWHDGVLQPAAPPTVPFYVDSFGHYAAKDLTWSSDGRYIDLWSEWEVGRLLTGAPQLVEEHVYRKPSTLPALSLQPRGRERGYWLTSYGHALATDLSHAKPRTSFTRWGEYDCNWLDDERVVCAENQTTHRWLLSRFGDSELLGIYTVTLPEPTLDCPERLHTPVTLAADRGMLIVLRPCNVWLLRMPGE